MDLVGDIGGTHVRLGLIGDDRQLSDIRQTLAADHASLEQAINDYLASVGNPSLARAALGVAATVSSDDMVRSPNGPRWMFSQSELKARFGLRTLTVINDFEAAAWSVPVLGSSDLAMVGETLLNSSLPKLVLGPGTAFGLATMVRVGEAWTVLSGEAGELLHPRGSDAKLFSYIADRFQTSRIGGVLSGRGLWRLLEAVRVLEFGQVPTEVASLASDIVALAAKKQNAAALRAVEIFVTTLGAVAANLALPVMATGGVYLTGGVIKGIHSAGLLDTSRFRRSFERQGQPGLGAIGGVLQSMGTALVTHDYPALKGLQYLSRL